MQTSPSTTHGAAQMASLVERVRDSGNAFVPARDMRAALLDFGSLDDWQAFCASWNDMPIDPFMADHGRYRRRRHAVYAAPIDGPVQRQTHRPHYQGLDYNPVNGGIERLFEPIDPGFGSGPSMRAILSYCQALFAGLLGLPSAWQIEAHQFRIEAVAGQDALPTPEGMHRDGVDYVLVLLVRRCNIGSGTTMIGTGQQGFTSSFTLTEPFDAAIVDDHRVFHGVTPVEAIDPGSPAYRDVLVVTFRRA